MRISDWSSDVCSSDLTITREIGEHRRKTGTLRVLGSILEPLHAVEGRGDQSIEGGDVMFVVHVRILDSKAIGRTGFSVVSPTAQFAESAEGRSAPPCWSCCRSEEHTSELQSLMRLSYAVFCLKKQQSTSYLTTITQSYDPYATHT